MPKIMCLCQSCPQSPRYPCPERKRNGKRKTSPVTQKKGNVDSGEEIAFVYLILGKSICLVKTQRAKVHSKLFNFFQL